MAVRIRDAGPSDLDALVGLNDQIQQQHAQQYPDQFVFPTVPADVRRFFETLIGQDDQRVLAADTGGPAIGYLWYEIRRKSASPFKPPGMRFHIHHVCVAQAARRTGVGAALFAQVEAQAAAAGAPEIVLDTWVQNDAGQAFFKSKGFAPRRIEFSKRLP